MGVFNLELIICLYPNFTLSFVSCIDISLQHIQENLFKLMFVHLPRNITYDLTFYVTCISPAQDLDLGGPGGTSNKFFQTKIKLKL